ncbi:MAG: AMP-binding protein [Dehalococcoidia bacterium]|nr:AMP-binding protein [Dehalococcoidia bacterium]
MERLTVGEYFDRTALGMGEREAAVMVEARLRLRYRDLYAHVTRVAKGLMGLGVDVGDHVALFASNRIEWVLLQLAVAKIGAVFIPIDPASGADDLAHVLAHSDASTLFLVDRVAAVSLYDVLAECCPELAAARPGRLSSRRFPLLKRVALIGDAARLPGTLVWSEVLGAGAGITNHLLRCRQDSIEPADLAMIQYTADTANPATGVELTHLNLVNEAIAVADCMRLGRNDRLCMPVSFARPFGSVVGTLGSLGRGATLVLPAEHFDAGKTLAAITAERCTALNAEPRMFRSVLRHPDVIRLDLTSLRTGVLADGTAPAGLVPEATARLHLPHLTVAYGQPETTAVVTQTRIDDPMSLRDTTVGRALPDVEVKIVDPTSGVEVPVGSEGELCCRGFPVMRGYYKMPERTAATIGGNGWLRTGDLAVMDRFGYCTITGRGTDAFNLDTADGAP